MFPLCSGGHLAQLLGRSPNMYLTEEKAKRIIRQVASAVAHLHSLGICHRDIKLQNILLEGADDAFPQIKLIDFGAIICVLASSSHNMSINFVLRICVSLYGMSSFIGSLRHNVLHRPRSVSGRV